MGGGDDRRGYDLRPRRLAALAAAVAGVAGAALLAVAVAGSPDPWTGYVSEAGIPGRSGSVAYRAGIMTLATAAVLLGAALRRDSCLAAGLLVLSGGLAATSGAVPCSDGCPLPPYDRATPQDLVHAGASALAVGAALLAMLRLAATATRSAVRTVARCGAAVAAPLAAALAAALLALGPVLATGLLERATLAAVIGWLVATGLARTATAEPVSSARPAARGRTR